MTSSAKYARLERERRFLLARGPDAAEGDQVLRIEDRYLEGTRLRLRLVRQDGQEPVYKLGQKIRVDPAQPSTVAHTTLYLDRREYGSLHRLSARTLTKTRTLRPWNGLTLAVDVFAGELEGLVLAEIDLGDPLSALPATAALPSPDEVTQDERFTGGALASTSREQLRNALRARPAPGGRSEPASRSPGPLDLDQPRRRPDVPVRLEPVSADNVRDVCALRVAVGQERFVTANAVWLAEAQFHPAAWVRAAYAGEDLVGFVMLHDSDDGPGYMLWRLMIDSRFQSRGYGRQVVHLVQEHLRERPSAHALKVGARGGPEGPAAFYVSLGLSTPANLSMRMRRSSPGSSSAQAVPPTERPGVLRQVRDTCRCAPVRVQRQQRQPDRHDQQHQPQHRGTHVPARGDRRPRWQRALIRTGWAQDAERGTRSLAERLFSPEQRRPGRAPGTGRGRTPATRSCRAQRCPRTPSPCQP